MKYYITIIFLLVSSLSFSQNLVSNGSFEDTVACPTTGSAIYDAVGWSSYSYSPDYFNSCNNGLMNVPFNFGGFQNARTGSAYAGVILYLDPYLNAKECLGTQLTQPLTIGQRYNVYFYVVMGYNMQTQQIGIASNKIGIKLSTVPYSQNHSVPIDNISQVYSDSVITDTLNWTLISGYFIADSSYNYFSIGCFFDDSLVTKIWLNAGASYSYYFIDDISLSADSNFVNSYDANNPVETTYIFPNPANDKIYINSKINIRNYSLVNSMGETVKEGRGGREIDVSILQNGFYLLEFDEKYYFKLIINHTK